MKNILAIFLICFAFSAQAVDRITATISFTNAPTDGATLTVNGSVRTWKNTVATPSIQIATTNNAANSATNYFNQVIAYQYGQPLVVSYVNATNIQLIANTGDALTISSSGSYISISYYTQAVAFASTIRSPVSALGNMELTNSASAISAYLNSTANTNIVSDLAPTMANFVSLAQPQTISGIKTFSGGINGTIGTVTNGNFKNPTTTNLVNYGNAISSPGSASGSEQFGISAQSSGVASLAVGDAAIATSSGSTAIGNNANATGGNSASFGAQSLASGPSSTALGTDSTASQNNSTAVGEGATATNANSTAIGAFSSTTADNQVRLGAASQSVSIPGGLQVEGSITNSHWIGTNTLDGDLSFTRKSITTLANGNNNLDASTNLYIKVSGPTAAFTINSIIGGRDGRLVKIQNSTGFTMTIANESGFTGTAANRTLTGLNADYSNTNNPGMVTLIYDGSVSRWILDSHN